MRELKGTYEPVEIEEQIRRYWYVHNIQEKVEKLNDGNQLFKFLEGLRQLTVSCILVTLEEEP